MARERPGVYRPPDPRHTGLATISPYSLRQLPAESLRRAPCHGGPGSHRHAQQTPRDPLTPTNFRVAHTPRLRGEHRHPRRSGLPWLYHYVPNARVEPKEVTGSGQLCRSQPQLSLLLEARSLLKSMDAFPTCVFPSYRPRSNPALTRG